MPLVPSGCDTGRTVVQVWMDVLASRDRSCLSKESKSGPVNWMFRHFMFSLRAARELGHCWNYKQRKRTRMLCTRSLAPFLARVTIFPLLQTVQTNVGVYLSSLTGNACLFCWVKRPGRQACHLSILSIRNEWRCTSTTLLAFMSCAVVNLPLLLPRRTKSFYMRQKGNKYLRKFYV